jgi:uncharacterized membrane protein YfcA
MTFHDTPLWLPPLAAFVVSFFTSMAGISGAVLLLPFQVSVLGFATPAVSSTNLVFNIVAIPSGVYRYFREGRLIWPLTLIIVAGTAPGVVLGGLVRLRWMPEPARFKAFAGLVLLYIGARLFFDLRAAPKTEMMAWKVRDLEFTWRRLAFDFQGQTYCAKPPTIFLLSLVVGIVGGAYGIGGGAIIAPFLVAMCGLPVYTVAGATLMGTFVTSVFGVAFYSSMGVGPHWTLGLLFGLGGMAGMYLGARTQRRVPAFWLKLILGLVLLSVALGYLYSFICS